MSTGLALCIAGKSIFLYRNIIRLLLAMHIGTGLALCIDSFLVIPRRSVMSRRLTRHLLDRPVDSRKK